MWDKNKVLDYTKPILYLNRRTEEKLLIVRYKDKYTVLDLKTGVVSSEAYDSVEVMVNYYSTLPGAVLENNRTLLY